MTSEVGSYVSVLGHEAQASSAACFACWSCLELEPLCGTRAEPPEFALNKAAHHGELPQPCKLQREVRTTQRYRVPAMVGR